MHDIVYRVCSDTLVQALALAESQVSSDLPTVRQRFLASLERMAADGARLGVAAADLAEARYALVAFIDEQVSRSSWSQRADWMKQPLQLILYQESAAGEHFFIRLRALLRMANRVPAIQAYGLCLALGFRGAYAQAEDSRALSTFTQAVERKLAKVLPSPDVISPHLSRTAEKPRPSPASRRLLAFGATAATLAIFVVGLCAGLVSRASELALVEVVLSFDSQELTR
jgi:type VI secretion system protein ImpK